MIIKAIERGVSDKRIAKALNLALKSLQKKTQLLNGICAEAVDLLKKKHIPDHSFSYLRKMVPLRQIEAAELIVAMNNFSPFRNRMLPCTVMALLIVAACDTRQKAASHCDGPRPARITPPVSAL